MGEPRLKPEAQRIEEAFLFTLGSEVIAREKDGEANIADLDHDLLTKFFRAGWNWGKESLLADQRRERLEL